GFRKVVTQAQLPRVLDAYDVAIVDVFWIATAGAIVAFVASLRMEWVSVKPPETTVSLYGADAGEGVGAPKDMGASKEGVVGTAEAQWRGILILEPASNMLRRPMGCWLLFMPMCSRGIRRLGSC